MRVIFLHLILARIVVCEETSSFLTNVLMKIQRERLGQLEKKPGNDVFTKVTNENNDYMYLKDGEDESDDYYISSGSKNEIGVYDAPIAEESKNKVVFKGAASLPHHDLIYIYNDTIYLYKAPNNSADSGKIQLAPYMNARPMKNAHAGMIKMKMKRPPSHDNDDAIRDTDPDNLIDMAIDDEESGDTTEAAPEDEDVEGYYYYYYPLDNIPPELADSVSSMLSSGKPAKPGMAVKPAKKPMKPGMPMTMMMKKKKRKQPVGPLFKAMAVFVGTAVVFIVSILLLPRVKLVKAKSNVFYLDEMTGLPYSFDEERKFTRN